jgi:hypothetical protein
MLPFEKLARFVTGSSCETNRRSIGIRDGAGLFLHTLFYVFALVFAGAGNAGASHIYVRYFVPITIFLFLAYFAGAIFLLINNRYQLAQYLAWTPLLLIGHQSQCLKTFARMKRWERVGWKL